MKENSSFYWPRFAKLFRKEVMEHGKTFLLRILTLYGVFAVILVGYACVLYGVPCDLEQLQHHIYRNSLLTLIGIFIGGGIESSSYMMAGMRNKASRITNLMTPATPFEKYFVRWFLCVFLFLPLCLLVFILADYTRWLILLCFYADQPIVSPIPLCHYLIERVDHYGWFASWAECFFAITVISFIHSLFALGSTLWSKSPILKTFIISLLLFLAYVFFGSLLFTMVVDEDTVFNGPAFFTQFSENQVYLIVSVFLWVAIFFHWVLGYYRFKESEIINRW